VYWISSINTFTETFIPAVMILIANISSREPGNHRYEIITGAARLNAKTPYKKKVNRLVQQHLSWLHPYISRLAQD